MLGLLLAVNVSVAAGAGSSEDFLGVQIQARQGRFALFAATGPLMLGGLLGDSGLTYSASFGVRWYSSDEGGRFFLSAQWAFFKQQTCHGSCGDREFPPTWELYQTATLVAGWRFKWTSFFVDAGIGGGLFFQTGFSPAPIPDATLALGWEF